MKVKLRLGINKLHINKRKLSFPAAQKIIDAINSGKLHPSLHDITNTLHVNYKGTKHYSPKGRKER